MGIIVQLYAIPAIPVLLLAVAAATPAHAVPCQLIANEGSGSVL